MEEPLSKKAKMVSNEEGEDDLERLEPMPQSNGPRQSPMNGGQGVMGGTPSSSFPPNDGGVSSSSFPPSNQPQQGSVLQELLLSSVNCSTASMNSPRTGYSGHSVPSQQPANQTANYTNRSPMQSGVAGGVAGGSMMSPPQGQPMTGRPAQMGVAAASAPSQLQQRPAAMGTYPTDQMHYHQQQQMMGGGGVYGMGGMGGMGGPGRGPPGYAMQQGQTGQGRGQSATGMGRGAMMVANGAPVQRAPHMQQRTQSGMMHPNLQQPQGTQLMNRGILPQGYDQSQMMGQQRDYMNVQQTGYNGMPTQMTGRPQGQPQYPGGTQQMMSNQQMMMGDQAMHMQQQQLRQGMMANGMSRQAVPPGHSAGIAPPLAQALPQAAVAGQMGVVAPPMGQSAQDPEKRKLIQQQLVLLLHAHKCQQRERHQDGSTRNTCTLPHCSTMKEVLQHMTTCNNGRQCGYAHCASSRQIIHHWKNCQREDCPVCRPLKNIQASTPGQVTRMSDLGDVGGLLLSQSIAPPANHLGQPLPMQQQMGNATGGRAGANDLGSPNAASNMLPINANVRQQLLGDYTPNEMRSPNGGHRGNGMGGGGTNIQNWPPPEQPTTNKNWHSDVTNDLRHHLVGKLVKAIFPSPDPAAMHDQRIKDLIQYARKVEKDMFENADDREEYYHLLAEKIYKIQKELQEKKQKRLSESRGNGLEMGSVKSEMGGSWTDGYDGTGPSTSGEGMGQSNGFAVKKEEIDDSSSANGSNGMANGMATGWNPALVKEEPSTSQSACTTAHPATSMSAKKEPKRELSAPPPGSEYVHDQTELIKNLEPILTELDKSDDAIPFKMPVDPQVLNIPDYFDIVKHPMDLSTMSEKLRSGVYTNPWQFCDDMWLMFDNAWLYNRKNSKVYKYSTKLSELFMALIEPVMRDMGYCCGHKLCFTPLALFCYGASMCTIGRDQSYYCYETTSNAYGVVVSERYTYCTKCYEGLPDEGISLSENPNDKTSMVPKNQFKICKNNVIEVEPFENCKYCHRRWHKICALHDKKVFPEGFVCQTCRKDKNMPLAENKFLAKKLATCKLSNHLEERVNGYIAGRLKGGEHHEVVIRVLSVVEKEVEVKPMMKSKYCGDAPGAFPQKFPYKTKAIFAFEVINGIEVCFFGLHVQEYGSACPAPNQRRVYIAYLDSVHYFEPRQLRTDVYHEILLGYLEYAKKLGYTMAHIWACPPSEGDDYIFHCHPTEQKIPKPKRLQDWYKKMLDKGVQEQCVVEYKDIYKQAKDDGLTSPADLPYFEGDFWPNVIEDCIREASSEEAQRKKEENDEDAEDEDLFTAGGGNGDNGKKKGSKSKKNNLKKSSSKSKKKAGSMTGNEVTDKLYAQLEKHKEVFFTIRLVTQQSALSLTAEIEDPDPLMSSELMDGRDTFLTKAREEHWEFSSLRRSKYSTLCLAHALHVQEGKGMEYTCNQCDSSNAHWHCNTCDDFDLCDSCKATVQHEHPLEKVKTILDEGGGSGGEGAGSSNRYESIQRCIHSLVHACTCRDANCRRMSCHKMKRVVAHTKVCKKRVNASCPVCKQLIALCCYHAKHCQKEGCQVPFCMNIRQKLMEQKRSLARRADMMMRRRMEGLSAVANAAAAGPSTAGPSTSNTNPPSAGASSMVSSSGGPSSVSSMSSHNMKGGGSGTAMPSSSNPSQSHSSPIDHRNSKFGGQAQSPYSSAMGGSASQSTSGSSHASGGMGMGGPSGGQSSQQFSMGMTTHPQMAGTHMMAAGKPANPAMIRTGMDASGGMGTYRQSGGGQGGQPQYGGMAGGVMGSQTHPMHSIAMRQAGHDQQRMQQQQQRGTPSLQQQQWQSTQAVQSQYMGRAYGSGQPQMTSLSHNAAQYHYARAPQQQYPTQMGQQGMMGQQQAPPMVSSKPGDDAAFR